VRSSSATRDASGGLLGRADLYYAKARLAVEYDGDNHRDRLVQDDRRQNALLAAGFRIPRYTASDVNLRAGAVATQVRAELERR
jgi:very-short-patch-repair endonuclease